jgi:hypothetical protein
MNWLADLAPDPEMLMFSDEVSKDERTSNRHRGWSHKGMSKGSALFMGGDSQSFQPSH